MKYIILIANLNVNTKYMETCFYKASSYYPPYKIIIVKFHFVRGRKTKILIAYPYLLIL